MTVPVRTAADLLTLDDAAWLARRAQRDDPVLRAIWREFVAHGGPVPLDRLAAGRPAVEQAALPDRLAALDAADLVGLDGGAVRVAYPFTADPSAFEVRLAGGRRCHACCAVDALGIAPMIGACVTVIARCHATGTRAALDVDPAAGPQPAPPGWLVWIERGRFEGVRRSGFL